MNDDIRNLVFEAVDGSISKDDFERLQNAIADDAAVREYYLNAINLTETLSEIASEQLPAVSPAVQQPRRNGAIRGISVAAAGLIICVAGAAYWLGRSFVPGNSEAVVGPGSAANSTGAGTENNAADFEDHIAGHAILRRSVDLTWPAGGNPILEGQVLNNGTLEFEDGVAEIDFFCGATLIVEGPAMLEIESDWSVQILRGRLRASVPPAARGFVVKAADSEIIDLGTEFVLDVDLQNARVEVIDGEVELRGGEHHGVHLTTGQGRSLAGDEDTIGEFARLSTAHDIRTRRDDAVQIRLESWRRSSQQLASDSRLLAYFPLDFDRNANRPSELPRFVSDASSREHHGMMVGPVSLTSGRFGERSTGLDFGRAGARVRTMIDGDFDAFTFCCWVRIDNLEHTYNALFMGDGYENGEPHWQIREDGRLMFSVMVDDSQSPVVRNTKDGQPVTDAGLHRVYFTEPFWDLSKSGQWFHLAAVYDPQRRRVRQYVNGEQISDAAIEERFHISTLRIGAGEIGNWGQPFRSTPWFAVRNLNGVIDELAIFSAALPSEEIRTQYEEGKPVGY